MTNEAHKALFEKILSYAIYLLSAREYSTKLLQEKIQKKFRDQKSYYSKTKKTYETTQEKSSKEKENIDFITKEVILFLTEKKYLDDTRTAENLLRYRREYSPRGRRTIAQDMYKKKISEEISEKILEEFSEEEELSDCITLAKKKWNHLNTKENYQEKEQRKTKLLRFLAGKGFPYSMIITAWEEISEISEISINTP